MPDDSSNSNSNSSDSNGASPLDPGRVVAMDPDDLKYWCAELHCTEEELKQAMGEVGDHVTALRDRLARRRHR